MSQPFRRHRNVTLTTSFHWSNDEQRLSRVHKRLCEICCRKIRQSLESCSNVMSLCIPELFCWRTLPQLQLSMIQCLSVGTKIVGSNSTEKIQKVKISQIFFQISLTSSIVSMSITSIFLKPIIARSFRSSQPSPPAPVSMVGRSLKINKFICFLIFVIYQSLKFCNPSKTLNSQVMTQSFRYQKVHCVLVFYVSGPIFC